MICLQESSGFEVTKLTNVKNGGGILKLSLLYFVILSWRSALKQRFKQPLSDSDCRGRKFTSYAFYSQEIPPKVPHVSELPVCSDWMTNRCVTMVMQMKGDVTTT